MRPLRVAVVLAVVAAVLAPSVATARDYADTALAILPAGQWDGQRLDPRADLQARMYDRLTPLFDRVTDADLRRTFKSAALGTRGQCPCRREAVPRRGVRIVRDRYGVPHVTGRDRLDLAWAAGWVVAADRELLLRLTRYPARFAALDAPGVDPLELLTSLTPVTVTRQADRIIARQQTAALRAHGREGRALLREIDQYVAGINARLRRDRSTQRPFRRVDVYALNALAGALFGQGGGDEARRSMLLDGLRRRLGATAGTRVFDDLAQREDADTPVTIRRRFPYAPVPRRSPGSVVIDHGSLDAAGRRAAATAARTRRPMSNFLLVGARRSTNGHPLLVAGPQTGYVAPGLMFELDLRAPGIRARGAAMPGGVGNILIGRGPDFAWSLTSAGSDTNDQFVETLCGGSDTRYRHRGRCRRMGSVDAGTIGGAPVRFRTTVHGPVVGYARAEGRRVAISLQRSSRGREIVWQLMLRRLTHGRVSGVRSFMRAAALSPLTFNVAYADDRDIAMYSTGLLPRRDPRVDPRLPTRGTGEYEWRGFMPARAHPRVVNPRGGLLVNWNNRPATGFPASDANWSQGSTQRVSLLTAWLARRRRHDLASVTGAMNAAATQDLRVAGPLLDGIRRLLAGSPAPTPRAQAMLDALLAWRAAGASRLDRDLDGAIDAGAGPAIMDELYPRLADAVLTPVLGERLNAELRALVGATNDSASGFTGGRINHVDKDLRTVTGTRFRTPFRTRFCGRGDVAACRAAVWRAFEETGAALAAAHGSDDPARWRADANAERIRFLPGLLPTTLRYTNRPSGIQQLMTFSGHRPVRR